jgi:hypothetical protein
VAFIAINIYLSIYLYKNLKNIDVASKVQVKAIILISKVSSDKTVGFVIVFNQGYQFMIARRGNSRENLIWLLVFSLKIMSFWCLY